MHWGYFDAALQAVIEIESGETLRLRSVSGSPDDPVPPDWMPPEIPIIYSQVKERGPGPHILTGPVFVRGARPGSVLEVNIMAIQLGAPYGYNIQAPLRGLFPDAFDKWDRFVMPIDLETRTATILPGVRIPTNPFFGVLGVAPPAGWGRIDSLAPGRHGGNLDNKELVAGATLFLPVWVEGALFSGGDGHAAQGDGEVDVTALETCLEGEFRLTAREDFELSLPVAATPTHFITMGFDPDLDRAAQIAVDLLLNLLVQHCRLSWRDAYRLASIAADVHVTQVVNGVKGVHVMVTRTLLRQLSDRLPFFAPPSS